MIGEPIDPTPFESAMPEKVRDAIARARTERGLVSAWLVARGRGWGQVGTSMTLLRDPKVTPELAGWLAGMAMFHDDTDRLADALEGNAAAAHALEAFVAGIHAGIAPAPGQWERVERIAAIGRPPPSLATVVPIGIASEEAPVRAAAKRLAKKLGSAAQAALDTARSATKGTERRRLSALQKALPADSDDREALLLRLLGSWRATRASELESAISALGVELARGREAIIAKSRSAIEEAWAVVAKQRDPVDVDRLIAVTWPKSLDAARKRVELFMKFPPDPRITKHVTTSALRHRSSQSIRFHRAVAELLLDAPAKNLVAAIDAIVNVHDDERIVETYREARDLAADAKTLPADRALVEEAQHASARRHARSKNLDELWARHIEDPGDLGHRAVLGDALQLAGDPRGELIALQLAASPDATMKKRIADLIAANADLWTGPIPNVSKSSRRFERGFLVAMRCTGAGRELRAVYERPEWVTLEELYLDGANCELATLVRRMPLLRRFATPHRDLLVQLARTGKYPSLQALSCERGYMPSRKAFPNVRVMACDWIERTWNRDTFLDTQTQAAEQKLHAIVHLGFPAEFLSYALDLRTRGPAETRFAIDGDYAGFDTNGWRVRVFKSERVAELAWGGGPSGLKDNVAPITEALRDASLAIREVKRIDLGAIS